MFSPRRLSNALKAMSELVLKMLPASGLEVFYSSGDKSAESSDPGDLDFEWERSCLELSRAMAILLYNPISFELSYKDPSKVKHVLKSLGLRL